jgi:hypothetical protein
VAAPPDRKQVNYRLPPSLIDYIERWHRATGKDREEVVARMIEAYKEAVGEPPKPVEMPSMTKPSRK